MKTIALVSKNQLQQASEVLRVSSLLLLALIIPIEGHAEEALSPMNQQSAMMEASKTGASGEDLEKRIASALEKARNKLQDRAIQKGAELAKKSRTKPKHINQTKAPTQQAPRPAIQTSNLDSAIDQAIRNAENKLNRKVTEHQISQKTIESSPVFKTPEDKNLKKQTKEMLKQASVVYRDEKDFVRAYELSQDILKLDPHHRGAKRMIEDIQNDLDNKAADLIDKNQTYIPPDGVLAYKIAISDGVVSLKEARDIAVKSSVSMRSLRKRIDGANRKLLEAKRAMFPTLSGELSVNAGVLARGQIGAYTGENFKINFSQPMFYGGELLFTMRQAESNVKSDELKLEKERLDVIQQVSEAYHGVVSANYNYDYQEELLNSLDEYRNLSDAAFRDRLIPEIDYLETLSIYNQVVFQKESSFSSLQSSNLTFFEALGLDMNAQKEVPVDLSLEFEPMRVEMEEFLSQVQQNNIDIRIKETDMDSAYFASKIFDARKLPRIDLRGSAGLQGEVPVDHAAGPDLEKEHFIGLNVSMPWEGNTASYSYERRFFGPTVSSFQGSEDYKHTVGFSLLDKLGDMTDEELARADYLKTKADLQKEKADQNINAKEAYYDYQGAILQMRTSEAKIGYREKQVEILKYTVSMKENKMPELLNEMQALTEDKFSRVTAIKDAKNALSNMNRLIGIEGYYERDT